MFSSVSKCGHLDAQQVLLLGGEKDQGNSAGVQMVQVGLVQAKNYE